MGYVDASLQAANKTSYDITTGPAQNKGVVFNYGSGDVSDQGQGAGPGGVGISKKTLIIAGVGAIVLIFVLLRHH